MVKENVLPTPFISDELAQFESAIDCGINCKLRKSIISPDIAHDLLMRSMARNWRKQSGMYIFLLYMPQ
jgi:hypothetical protein